MLVEHDEPGVGWRGSGGRARVWRRAQRRRRGERWGSGRYRDRRQRGKRRDELRRGRDSAPKSVGFLRDGELHGRDSEMLLSILRSESTDLHDERSTVRGGVFLRRARGLWSRPGLL